MSCRLRGGCPSCVLAMSVVTASPSGYVAASRSSVVARSTGMPSWLSMPGDMPISVSTMPGWSTSHFCQSPS